MKNYGFADGNGDQITRGLQLQPGAAYKRAQRYANERGIAVDFWEEGIELDEDGVAKGLVTVFPEDE